MDAVRKIAQVFAANDGPVDFDPIFCSDEGPEKREHLNLKITDLTLLFQEAIWAYFSVSIDL